jgi:hypothetical protein
MAMTEVITCHHDLSSSYAKEILKQDYYNISINLHNFVFTGLKFNKIIGYQFTSQVLGYEPKNHIFIAMPHNKK